MEWLDFEKNTQDLKSYFNCLGFRPEHFERYFSKLNFIPERIYKDIVSEIIETKRPTSGNFPTIRELETLFYEYKNEHPESFVFEVPQTDCNVCKGSGMVEAWRQYDDAKAWYRAYLACGECGNWKRTWGRSTRIAKFYNSFLLDTGHWRLDNPLIQSPNSYRAYESLAEMAESFGEWPDEVGQPLPGQTKGQE